MPWGTHPFTNVLSAHTCQTLFRCWGHSPEQSPVPAFLGGRQRQLQINEEVHDRMSGNVMLYRKIQQDKGTVGSCHRLMF